MHPTSQSADTQPNDKAVLVYATFPAGDMAAEVGLHLVESGLAACVNVIPGMTSIYRWEGQVHQDAEVVAIIKTRAAQAQAVMDAVRARHSYDNPALMVISLEGGSTPFLAWILEQTRAAAI